MIIKQFAVSVLTALILFLPAGIVRSEEPANFSKLIFNPGHLKPVDSELKVKVGDVPHPMLDEHHIEWIEIIADGMVYRKALKPGDPPEAKFWITGDNVTVRSYCNIHGLWKSGSE